MSGTPWRTRSNVVITGQALPTMTITIPKRKAVRVALLILWECIIGIRRRSGVSFTIGDEP